MREYLRPVRQRWMLIAGFVVIVTVATYVYYDRQPRTFEASTQVLIAAAASPLGPAAGELSDRTIQNQVALLTSRTIARAVARRLGRPGLANELRASITSQVEIGSDLLRITARRQHADEAASVANAFAQAFVQLRSNAERSRMTRAIGESRAQLAALKPTAANANARTSLADSIRQLELMRATSSGAATQIEPALAPSSPASARPTRKALLALALSLIGSVGLAFAAAALDGRPRRLEELRDAFDDLPVLAVLPHADRCSGVEDGRAAVGPTLKEPMRLLRTNIRLAALDQPFKRILVTSAVAGEGKSTVVRDLAIVLREGGARVAVVDCDLRRPTLAASYGQQPELGLTDVLTGKASLEDALVHVPVHVRGLDTLAEMDVVPSMPPAAGGATDLPSDAGTIALLCAGPLPADPQAVLAADRTRLLLADLAAQHDVVLIDSPPLLAVSDTAALAAWVDAVVIVARLGVVSTDNARSVVAMLERISSASSIGIVVNDTALGDAVRYGYGATRS